MSRFIAASARRVSPAANAGSANATAIAASPQAVALLTTRCIRSPPRGRPRLLFSPDFDLDELERCIARVSQLMLGLRVVKGPIPRLVELELHRTDAQSLAVRGLDDRHRGMMFVSRRLLSGRQRQP